MGIKKPPLDCSTGCLKFLVVIGNILFILLGIGLLSLGIYTKLDINKKHIEYDRLDIVPLAIVGLGAAIAVIGFLGFCAAYNQSRFFLGLYFIILLILLMAQLGSVVFGLVEKGNLPTILEKMWYNVSSPAVRVEIENLFYCCGYDTLNCTNGTIPPDGTQTCKEALDDFVSSKLNVIIGVLAGFFVIQTVWLGMSCCLFCGLRREEEQETLLDQTRQANRNFDSRHNHPDRHPRYSRVQISGN
jgi:small-conductance mechanosensitive channel